MNVAHVFLMWVLSVGTAQTQAPTAAAQPASSQPAVKVKVTVSAAEEIARQIQEYIAVQFQSLGDVQLVAEDPDWSIEVVTTQLQDGDGTLRALGLSFVIQRHGPHVAMLEALAQACRYFVATGYLRDQPLEYHMQRLLRGVTALPLSNDLVVVSKHKMCVILPDKLPQACYDIVSALEEERFDRTAGSKSQRKPSPEELNATTAAGK
jgi:hypothetical protein